MEPEDKYKLLIDTYSNQTKMKIIFLLADEAEMTVTQMASHIDVSRSNLYHFVRQMVDDGILTKPSVRPKDNYVEKYYRLNPEFFNTLEWEHLAQQFTDLSAENFRSLYRSVLISYSFNLMLLAEKVESADSQTLEQLKDSFLKREAISVYSSTHIGGYPRVEEHLREAMDCFEKPPVPSDDNPRLRILILTVPYI